jgi:hypothetical protein
MKYFHAERAFMMGVKPALLSNDRYEKITYLKENYPYYTLQKRPSFHEYLFFQTNGLMERYLEAVGGKPIANIPAHTKALGITLGYPPKAVEHFVKKRFSDDPEMEMKDVGLHFCGIHCASSMDSLIEDAKWLWEKYPHPELDELYICYEQESLKQEISLAYMDISSITFFQQVLQTTVKLRREYILQTIIR